MAGAIRHLSRRTLNAVEALYGTGVHAKFSSKKNLGQDSRVGPLEGLRRAQTTLPCSSARHKESWEWTMMIGLLPWITEGTWSALRSTTSRRRRPPGHSATSSLRILTRGACAQILHLGSDDDETPTLDRLYNQYLPENNLTFKGDHQLNDYLDADRDAELTPAKPKSLLRQPVKSV